MKKLKKAKNTQKKLEFQLKNKENRQKAGLISCFWALIGTNRDESAFLGRRAGRRVFVSKSGLSRRDRDGWQVCNQLCPKSQLGSCPRHLDGPYQNTLSLSSRVLTSARQGNRFDRARDRIFDKHVLRLYQFLHAHIFFFFSRAHLSWLFFPC